MTKREAKLSKLMKSPGGMAKLAASMLAPLKRNLNYEGRISQLFKMYLKQCVKCKVEGPSHYEISDHPFFGDNLSYLVWKHEQRIHKR